MNVPAAAGAEKVICCGVPEVSMNDAAGEGFIPFGNPVIVKFTAPANPFCGTSETITGEVVPPTCVETDGGETTILKSPVGGGGGDAEPAHPLSRHRPQIEIETRT